MSHIQEEKSILGNGNGSCSKNFAAYTDWERGWEKSARDTAMVCKRDFGSHACEALTSGEKKVLGTHYGVRFISWAVSSRVGRTAFSQHGVLA